VIVHKAELKYIFFAIKCSGSKYANAWHIHEDYSCYESTNIYNTQIFHSCPIFYHKLLFLYFMHFLLALLNCIEIERRNESLDGWHVQTNNSDWDIFFGENEIVYLFLCMNVKQFFNFHLRNFSFLTKYLFLLIILKCGKLQFYFCTI
jgi:hypothetical protein